MIYLQLFLSFLQIGLFSIGGGYAAIPLIQNQTVQIHHWLTLDEFMDLATIAEMTPGPIAINGATFVGNKVAGLLGAVVATFSNIIPSLVIVSVLSYIYARYKELPLLQAVLSALRAAVVALIASAGLNMLLQVGFGGREMLKEIFGNGSILWNEFRFIGLILFAGAFFILRKFKLSPILVMVSCGVIYLILGLIGVV